jgi:hypothetical protein
VDLREPIGALGGGERRLAAILVLATIATPGSSRRLRAPNFDMALAFRRASSVTSRTLASSLEDVDANPQ